MLNILAEKVDGERFGWSTELQLFKGRERDPRCPILKLMLIFFPLFWSEWVELE